MSNKIDVPFSNGYYYPPAPRPQVLRVIEYIQSGEVLDIGAGFGNNIIPLLDHDFHITATETNSDCLTALRQLAEEHPGKLDILEQPLETLHTDIKFDLILCTMVLHFLAPEDGRQAIGHIKSWTRPRGYNVITSYTLNNPVGLLREHGVTYFMQPHELYDAYEGWKIIEYTEEQGTGKNAAGQAFESARLIARHSS